MAAVSCDSLGTVFVATITTIIVRKRKSKFGSATAKATWFKQGLFTWHLSTFTAGYDQLQNKPNGLYMGTALKQLDDQGVLYKVNGMISMFSSPIPSRNGWGGGGGGGGMTTNLPLQTYNEL